MATTQQMLSAVNNMQVNAQAALPIIPNNGNPAGAYNMPAQAQPAAPMAPVGPDLSWLQPSQSMTMFQQGMQQRQQQLDMQRQQMYAPVQPTPVQPIAQAPVMPVMPQGTMLPSAPVLPQPNPAMRQQESSIVQPVMPNFNPMIRQQVP